MIIFSALSLVTFQLITSKSLLSVNLGAGLISQEKSEHLWGFPGPLMRQVLSSSFSINSPQLPTVCFFITWSVWLLSGTMKYGWMWVKLAGEQTLWDLLSFLSFNTPSSLLWWKRSDDDTFFLQSCSQILPLLYTWSCHVTMATAPAFGTTAGCKSGFAEQCLPPDKPQMLEADAFLWFLTVLGLLPDCVDLPEQQRALSLRRARFEHLLWHLLDLCNVLIIAQHLITLMGIN